MDSNDTTTQPPPEAPSLGYRSTSRNSRNLIDDETNDTTVQPPPKAPSLCHCSTSENSRNLIICIDGTSNKFGKKNTNIIELYSQIVKTDGQCTYYNSGIGTYARPSWRSLAYFKQLLSNKIDLAIAWNVEHVIQTAYRWLSDEYNPGDRIFLFGFSRGAYQVRALAGMIDRVGLLFPGNAEQIPFAYELYASIGKDRESDSLAKTFKNTFSRKDVRVHFVGVWDTVSSVGVIRGKTLPSTTSSCDHICYFRHALALDECRVKFLPEYVYGGKAEPSNSGHIKEVWFAGSHSDVGGGNRLNENLQSGDIPLQWMRSEAIAAGLHLNAADVTWKLSDLEKHTTNSLSPVWWILELFPFKRLLYYNSDRHTYRPHWGGPRKILPGQKVHTSVLFKTNYKPKARFWKNLEKWEEPMYWNHPDSHQRLSRLGPTWEKDIFDDVATRDLLTRLDKQEILDAVDRLAFMAGFADGKEAIKKVEESTDILKRLLSSKDQNIQLCAAAAMCELDDKTDARLLEEASKHMLAMLKSKNQDQQGRACVSLPSLCKVEDLRVKILTDDTLRALKDLCRGEQANTALQEKSTQALSLMVDYVGVTQKVIDIGAISEMVMLLHDTKHDPVKVAVMNILKALSSDGPARNSIRNANAIPTLVKLMKRNDHYVAVAAAEVICVMSRYADTRETILRSRALTVFLDVLEHPSGDVEGIGGRCVKVLGGYPDAQEYILQAGFVKKLIELSKSRVSDKSQSATRVIISLIDNGDSKLIRSVLVEHGFINTTIKQLRKQNYCHFAVAALGFFVKFDDLREIFLKSDAISSLIRMLRRGWFDGIADDNPLRSLSIILQHPDVRTAMLESGAIETLSKTLSSGEDASVSFASLKYIRIFASYEDGIDAIARKEAVLPIMQTLKSPHVALRFAGACTLSFLAYQNVFVRSAIVHLGRFELWSMLKSGRPDEIVGASFALRALANYKELCDSFPESTVLQSIYGDETLPDLPSRRDSMASGDQMLVEIHRLVESLRSGIGHDGSHPDDPFVAPRKRSSVLFVAALIPTILCCPCLLLCGLGQIAYQELLEEE